MSARPASTPAPWGDGDGDVVSGDGLVVPLATGVGVGEGLTVTLGEGVALRDGLGVGFVVLVGEGVLRGGGVVLVLEPPTTTCVLCDGVEVECDGRCVVAAGVFWTVEGSPDPSEAFWRNVTRSVPMTT